MHARVTTASGGTGQVDDGIATFRDNVVPAIREMGGQGAILLVNREKGTALSITLWGDEASMASSEERGNELRAQAAETIASTEEPQVDRYEVAVFEV
jgi:hypothetical protein